MKSSFLQKISFSASQSSHMHLNNIGSIGRKVPIGTLCPLCKHNTWPFLVSIYNLSSPPHTTPCSKLFKCEILNSPPGLRITVQINEGIIIILCPFFQSYSKSYPFANSFIFEYMYYGWAKNI